jgi:hypothetical protein
MNPTQSQHIQDSTANTTQSQSIQESTQSHIIQESTVTQASYPMQASHVQGSSETPSHTNKGKQRAYIEVDDENIDPVSCILALVVRLKLDAGLGSGPRCPPRELEAPAFQEHHLNRK